MQTFLPVANFRESAGYLDKSRLGKQRVEAVQILNTLSRSSRGWINHPAVRMWRGYEIALKLYHDVMVTAWILRGCNNSMVRFCGFSDEKTYDEVRANLASLNKLQRSAPLPLWLGREEFHLAHRSNLIRKDPDHYSKFWPEVPPDLPYVWPVQ